MLTIFYLCFLLKYMLMLYCYVFYLEQVNFYGLLNPGGRSHVVINLLWAGKPGGSFCFFFLCKWCGTVRLANECGVTCFRWRVKLWEVELACTEKRTLGIQETRQTKKQNWILRDLSDWVFVPRPNWGTV